MWELSTFPLCVDNFPGAFCTYLWHLIIDYQLLLRNWYYTFVWQSYTCLELFLPVASKRLGILSYVIYHNRITVPSPFYRTLNTTKVQFKHVISCFTSKFSPELESQSQSLFVAICIKAIYYFILCPIFTFVYSTTSSNSISLSTETRTTKIC